MTGYKASVVSQKVGLPLDIEETYRKIIQSPFIGKVLDCLGK